MNRCRFCVRLRCIAALSAFFFLSLSPGWADEPRDESGKIDDYNQWKQSLGATQATDPATISAPSGFRVELLRSATKDEGSWIALVLDPSGRVIVSRENKGLLRFTLSQDKSRVERVETVNDSLLECRGLLWAYDSLYANANNSKGLYRLRDTQGNDQFDEIKLLKATREGVGHGRNDLALGPDGMIYSIHGDDVWLPGDYDPSRSPLRNYSDARLLPCQWDSQMFNASMKLPGGYVARTDRDGRRWEVVAGGMRNPYGIDFNADGELFTYDADMEWDVGTPWYRPTRILHLVSGADFGWRMGTGPWRSWYPDSLPAVLDIGLGSPTAVRFGTKSHFPERYRRALFACDWSFGRILAVHLQPKGGSFSATAEPFLSGRPLNVTDIEFGPDGAMYFLTGGRKTQSGLYRVTFTGEPSSGDPPRPLVESEAAKLRKQLESLQLDGGDPSAIEKIWPHLASDDAFVRHAARVALEQRPVATWRDRALAENDFTAATTALLALARLGSVDSQAALLSRIAELPWDKLSTEQRVAALRAVSLGLARNDRLSDDRLAPLAELLNQRFPDASSQANELLCELLVYLRSPQVVSKTLALLQAAKTQEEKLQYLFLLRSAAVPWTLAERKAYFDLLRQAKHFYGANSMARIQASIRADALAGLTDTERTALAPLLVDEPAATQTLTPLAQRPFVRDWKLDDLIGSLESVGHGRNLAAGKATFAAALCNRCHRFAGSGGAVGPDLTPLARRFGRGDILLSILAPSRIVDDKYRIVTIETTEGQVLSGQIVGDDGKTLTLLPDQLAPEKTVRIANRQIEAQTRSIVSPMPAGLLNTFSKEEVLDLLAYLESEGESTAGISPSRK
jgi:putative heme-binding domain-containing protein